MFSILFLVGVLAWPPLSHPGAAASATQTSRELRVAYPDVETLDPQVATTDADTAIVGLLFRGLFATSAAGEPEPAAAVAVPTRANGGVAEDGLTITVRLRPGWRWSDGRQVVAGDVAYSLRRALNPRLRSPYAPLLFAIRGARAYASQPPATNGTAFSTAPAEAGQADLGMTTPEPLVLRLELTEPDAALPIKLSLPAFAPLRKDVVEANAVSEENTDWPAADMPVTGPFALSAYQPHQSAELRRNPAYGLGAGARLDRITFTLNGAEEAGVNALLAGQVDIAPVPAFRLATLAAQPALTGAAVWQPPGVTRGLRVNARRAPLTDARARLALALAIDRQAYTRVARAGLGYPATCWLPPGVPGHDPLDCTAQRFDPEEARALFAAAGADSRELILIAPADAAGRDSAEFLRAMLGDVLGVTVRVRYVSGPTAIGDEWDLALFGWQGDYPDPEAWLSDLFATNGPANRSGYSSAQVDTLLAAARRTEDRTERLALLRAAHREILADAAVIPLENPVQFALVGPRVRGLVTDARDGALPGSQHIEQITLVDD